jgi:bacterioferritin-associated ferredoxin
MARTAHGVATMIVCSCNVFSDLEVSAAFSKAEPPTIAQIYRRLGHQPTCGRCAHTIREIIGDDKRKQI